MAIFLFDVDGTICDNIDVHFETFNIIFNRYSKRMSHDLWKNDYIGLTGIEIISNFFKMNKLDVSLDHIKKLNSIRHDIYDKMVDRGDVQPFEGLINFLKKSRKKKNKHVIVTNGIKENVDFFLKKHNLSKYFDMILTPESYKPKPSFEMFEHVIDHYKCRKDEIYLFEDSILGIKTGLNFGIKVYSVKKTYGSILDVVFKKQLEKGSLDLINSFSDYKLRKLLKKI